MDRHDMNGRHAIRIGVVGYGYWGPNLVRNFCEAPGAEVVAVADRRAERLELVRQRLPSVTTTRDAGKVLASRDVDAIAIATPPASHFELASAALDAGKHVLVEKPLATSSADALALAKKAAARNLVLLTDHTFLYTGAVRKLVDLVRSGALGEINYYDAVRVNLGLFQSDLNVLWDLAVHDLSILDAIMPVRPLSVWAFGARHVAGQPENIAYLTLLFSDRQIAHVHVNWLAPMKVRRTLIGGRDRMVVYDDIEPSEKIKVYDCGALVTEGPDLEYQLRVSYRHGDVWAPHLDLTEGLQVEVLHFLDCIRTGARPLTDSWSGLRVVKVLEAAERSMRQRGAPVSLDWKDGEAAVPDRDVVPVGVA
jgi:predicted dehydrogenase